MKRLQRIAILTALIALPACAGPFDTCVKPYSSQVTWAGTVTELGQVVGAFLSCDPTFNGADAPTCALVSLETLEGTLGPDGKAIVNCLVAYYEEHGVGAQQSAARAVAVKREIHAEALRCERFALKSPGDGVPPMGPNDLSRGGPSDGRPQVSNTARPVESFAYAGPNVGAESARCDRVCGFGQGLPADEGCVCWRGAGRAGRWVSVEGAR